MRIFGLIGKKLGHSFSPDYFNTKFKNEGINDAYYKTFELSEISEFPALLRSHHDICGLNVTMPYKESLIPYLDILDSTALAVGAVNCIKFLKNGKLEGFNTDVIGFEKSLLKFIKGRNDIKKALVLGSGGAAKAVSYVLENSGIEFKIVIRSPSVNNILYKSIDAQLIK